MKKIKLYNIVFPIWLLIIFPPAWLAVLPLNFIVDSLVILLCFRHYYPENKFALYKKTIFKIWVFGFIADLIGTGVLYLSFLLDSLLGDAADDIWNGVVNSIGMNPFSNIWGLLWVLVAIFISALIIYTINLNITFKLIKLDEKIKKKISFILAATTAPYLFLLPTAWFY